MYKFISIITISLFSFGLLNAEESELDQIIKKLDSLYRSDSAYMEVEMKVNTPHWNRTMQMKIWGESLEKTFVTILSPRKDKGISTLRNDKEMWNFFPKINKVMKIPPSMMMGSWMGSDFTNDDLVKESSLREDYNARLVKNENDKVNYYIEFTPKEQTVSVWGKIIAKVNKESVLPETQEYFDEKGKLIRIMYFKDVKELGGRILPTTLELIPQNKKNHSTTVTYKKAEFNAEIDRNTFTLRNLQKIRR